jgi:hypothetical protein
MFSPMKIHSLAHRSLKSALLAPLAVLALGAGPASATTNEIEGVWSFNGGSVAIAPLPNGTFQGTVETVTKFDECTHVVGEVMWTGMTEQSDGSFWGFHQWFNNTPTPCNRETPLGPTAWRVLHESGGARYLKVCFSHPNTSQPKITPDGAESEATFGCVKSALIAPLPVVTNTVVLPPAAKTECTRQKSLKLKLNDPKYDPLKEVVVKINGKKVADVKGVKRIKKGVTLKNLPSGTYKVSVVATTILKQRLTGSQTYQSCTKGSGKIKLHRRPKKHHG